MKKQSYVIRSAQISFFILTMINLIPILVFAAPSDEIILLKYQGLHQAYEWRISETNIMTTPEWNINTTEIPVAPEKAWEIAKNWLKKQGKTNSDFVKAEICPFVPESEFTKLNAGVRKRYYYRIQCSPIHHLDGSPFDYMFVFVLMDGTVLEPNPIKSLER